MSIRVHNDGKYDYSISIGDSQISAFRSRWPASGLGGLRSLWAQFSKRNGDLVDTRANGRSSTERFDCPALVALIDDMQCYAEVRLGLDTGRCREKMDWKEYLGVPKRTRSKR